MRCNPSQKSGASIGRAKVPPDGQKLVPAHEAALRVGIGVGVIDPLSLTAKEAIHEALEELLDPRLGPVVGANLLGLVGGHDASRIWTGATWWTRITLGQMIWLARLRSCTAFPTLIRNRLGDADGLGCR